MELLFYVGECNDWDHIKQNIIVYDYPSTTLPKIGDCVIANEQLEAVIKRQQESYIIKLRREYVVGRIITPLGLVFRLGFNPSLAEVLVKTQSGNMFWTVCRIIPRIGDIIRLKETNLYVTGVELDAGHVTAYVSENSPSQCLANNIAGQLAATSLKMHLIDPVEVFTDHPLDVNLAGQDFDIQVEVSDLNARSPLDVNITGQDNNLDVQIYRYD